MISVFSLSSNSRVKTETVPHLQLISNGLDMAGVANVKTCWLPLRIFEYKKQWWCHYRSIRMTTVIELLIRIRQPILDIRQMQQIFTRNRDWENI